MSNHENPTILGTISGQTHLVIGDIDHGYVGMFTQLIGLFAMVISNPNCTSKYMLKLHSNPDVSMMDTNHSSLVWSACSGSMKAMKVTLYN